MLQIRKAYPGTKLKLKRDTLTWIGELTPTPLSRTYRVRLVIHKDGKPDVWLVSPQLQTRYGKRAPHLYPDDRLCLYLPRSGEWTPEMSLVDTIIPWISEWLAHYEVWLSIGEWTGGGTHPAEPKSERSARETAPERIPPASSSTPGIEPAPPTVPIETIVRPAAIVDALDALAPATSEPDSAPLPESLSALLPQEIPLA